MINNRWLLAACIGLIGAHATPAAADPLIPMLKTSINWGGPNTRPPTVELQFGVSYRSGFHHQTSLVGLGFSNHKQRPFQLNLLDQPIDLVLLLARSDQQTGMGTGTKAIIATGAVITGGVIAASIAMKKAFEDSGNNLFSQGDEENDGSNNQCGADITLFPPSTDTNDDC